MDSQDEICLSVFEHFTGFGVKTEDSQDYSFLCANHSTVNSGGLSCWMDRILSTIVMEEFAPCP